MRQKLWDSFLFTLGVFAFFGVLSAILVVVFEYGGIGTYFGMVFVIMWYMAYLFNL